MAFIGIALALFTLAIIGYAAKTLLKEHQQRKAETLPAQQVMPYLAPHVATKTVESLQRTEPFENFVVNSFDLTYFGYYGEYVSKRASTSEDDPELLFEHYHYNTSTPFAIECKWRAGYQDGAIHWANTVSIVNYHTFQKEEKIPVFIVIGVGGSPKHPEELYVIPLNKIPTYMHYLTVHFLKPYSKRPGSKFTLDPIRMELR
jgi:hypothetical protein